MSNNGKAKRGAALIAEMQTDALDIVGEAMDLETEATAEITLDDDGRPVLYIETLGGADGVCLTMRGVFNLLKFLKINEPDIFALAEGDQDAAVPHYAPDGASAWTSADV